MATRRVSPDGRLVEIDVTTIDGPEIRSFGPYARVIESAEQPEIAVRQRLEFPGPDGTYSPRPLTVTAKLTNPSGPRRLTAAPVSPEMTWLAGSSAS